MIHLLQNLFGPNCGLDWLTLAIGTTASLMLTGGRLRLGFGLSICSGISALTLACISGQHGFIAYNLILIALNTRGVLRGDRRHPPVTRIAEPANLNTPQVEAEPLRATA